MLETLGVIAKDDYAPFVARFEQLDKNGDGKLTRDDLVESVRLRRAETESVVACHAMLLVDGVLHESQRKLHSHALQLIVPAFIAGTGFVWSSMFGFVLLTAGLLHGISIG